MAKSPAAVANNITLLLNAVLGQDRFSRGPVDVEAVAREYSRQIAPDGFIEDIIRTDLDGCEGVLVPGDSRPRKWAIMYDAKQSPGRRAYTVAHEFGHFMLHRQMVDEDADFSGGFHCSKDAIERGVGRNIEKEADEFAASLLMPLDDFRRHLPSERLATIERLGEAATRYGVSLTAAALRWIGYTNARAILISSTDGFAHWAVPTRAAYRTGRFMRTRNELYEMPSASLAARDISPKEALLGVRQNAGVWFPEAVYEMCMKTDRYGFELTLLHFEGNGPSFQSEGDDPEDAYDRFARER
ncbi:ImmA/IrrE family metallo-endopeptidase [Rhizobium sp. PP-CC-3G-465]|uniref:ImmA/IrrE family metallo-endopeptidase n=1 Tax=Rhizobium sp. PP-CC-3G-465 TaxID=2135648 RepID=UPI001046B98A|nr:uncharacterized protein DUF955 [Rhizobium sp. PP-CC-3G-465]